MTHSRPESIDIKQARYEVQANREKLESAFSDLEDRIRLQTRKFEHLKYQAKAPERFVKLENEIKAMKARMGRKQD